VGIDIDPQAVAHANENAKINDLDKKVHFLTPEQLDSYSFKNPVVVLMNMISSEQKVAWNALIKSHQLSGIVISSGILEEQHVEYVDIANQFGWKIMHVEKREGWLGFIAKIDSSTYNITNS
jgi:ribosomal protein L11 methyltransferase